MPGYVSLHSKSSWILYLWMLFTAEGLYFSHLSLFLNFTSILQIFNIAKEVRPDGSELEPVVHFTSGVTR